MCVRAFLNSLLLHLAEVSLANTLKDASSHPACPLALVKLVISDAVTTDFAGDFLRHLLDKASHDGLEQAATDVYNFFTLKCQKVSQGHDLEVNQDETVQTLAANVAELPVVKQLTNINDTAIRSPSGRPTQKRRKL